MTQTITPRAATGADIPALAAIIEGSGLFTPEEAAGFAATLPGHFDAPEAGHRWSLAGRGAPIAAAYLAPETPEGVFNLLFIGVVPQARRRGSGAALLREAEAHLRGEGARLLLIDTSSLDAVAPARALYAAHGCAETGRVQATGRRATTR